MAVYADVGYSTGTVVADRSNYWRYYGLRRDPFTLGVKEDELCLFPRWEQYFDLLHYLCHSSNVLLTVVGSKGSGKTTFLRHFVERISDSARICQLIASPALDPTHLCSALVKDFELPPVHSEHLEDQLDTHLANLQHGSQLCLLVIDSAHRLPKESLELLFYLIKQQSECQMRLHVVLFGEPPLRDALEALTEHETDRELYHHLPLDRLELAETESYLKHRLSAAGLPAAFPLSRSNVTRIHNLAEGIPGRINAVARQVLIDTMQQRELYSLLDYIRIRKSQFLGAGVLLATLIVLAFFLGRGSHAPLVPVTHEVTAPKSQALSLTTVAQQVVANNPPAESLTTVAPLDKVANKSPVVALNKVLPTATKTKAATIVTTTTKALPTNLNLQLPPIAVSTLAMPKVLAIAASPVAQALSQQAQPKVATTLAASMKSVPVAALTKSVSTVVASIRPGSVAPAIKAVSAAPMESGSVASIKAVPQEIATPITTPAVETTTVTASLPTSAAEPKQSNELAVNQVPRSEQHHALKSTLTPATDSLHYAIQLLGVSNESALKQFIAKNHLADKTTYLHSYRQGKDWYTLLYGRYATEQAAQSVLQSLPQSIQDLHPWIRNVASERQG